MVLNEQMKSKRNQQKWSLVLLKATRSWREKRSWRKAALEVSKALLKNSAPEDKRSRSHIIRSCVIRSCIIQKLHHQKLCYQKLPHQKSFHQKLKINWICKRFKDWRIITAKAVYWIRKHNKRLVEFCNGHFKGVWRHVLAILDESVHIVLCTNCTTTFSTTLFCVHATRQENNSRIRLRLHRCSFG